MTIIHRRQTNRAFTIIELLVTLTIIVGMICILFPAIAATRESSRRIGCLNNLRQLSLAIQNYETSFHMLPSGVVNPTGPIHQTPDDLHVGWIVQLLPYLEQTSVARSIDTDVSVYDPVNRTPAMTNISSLHCMSNPSRWSRLTKGLGTSNYAACHHDVEAPIDIDNHGVFFLNSHINYSDITDGTSTTIFVGEKVIPQNDLGWLSGTRATLRNTGTPLNLTDQVLPPDIVGGFGSHHPDGANFMFGDGSVRLLHNRIQQDLYRRLGHRDDGELVTEGPY